jgi:hypothetical protein
MDPPGRGDTVIEQKWTAKLVKKQQPVYRVPEWQPGDVVGWSEEWFEEDWTHTGVIVNTGWNRDPSCSGLAIEVMVISRYETGTDPTKAELVGQIVAVPIKDLYAVGG